MSDAATTASATTAPATAARAAARPRALGPPDPRAEQTMVRMRDGVRLATDVYRPAGRGPFPTILTRLPYDKTGRDCFIPWVAAYLTERGYAFVAQDTRGKARSEGETLAFVRERSDGWDTLEWLSARRWCDGAIAMWGESYFGFTQWAAAASGHPALRAIVPRNTTARVGRDWLNRQGVPKLGMPLAWAADTWMDPSMYGLVPADVDWSARPLDALLPSLHGGRRSASFDQWRGCAEDDALWTHGLFGCADPAFRCTVSVLHVGGWFDVFHRGQLDDWATARASSGAPQLLVMDATDHVHRRWSAEPDGLVGLHDVPDAEIEAFMPTYLRETVLFYEHVLKGRDGPAIPGVRWRPAGGDWQVADRWPPSGSRELTLHLAAGARALADAEGGALTPAADGARSTVGWAHDPHDPVPSLFADELQSMAAPPDDRLVEDRADVLTFTSEPFGAGLELAGPVVADLVLSSSAATTHAMAKLVDVAPDGVTRRIGEGAALVRDAREERRVAVRVGSVAYRLRPGHRLRLEVASSAYPQHPPHPGTEADPWTATDLRATQQRLRTGGPHGARLSMTVLGDAPGA
jgi:uncharacterized protein